MSDRSLLKTRKEIIEHVKNKPFKKRVLTGFWIPAFNEVINLIKDIELPYISIFPNPLKYRVRDHKKIRTLSFLLRLILRDVEIYHIDNEYSLVLAKCIAFIIVDGFCSRVSKTQKPNKLVRTMNAFIKYHIDDYHDLEINGYTETHKFSFTTRIFAVLKEFYKCRPSFDLQKSPIKKEVGDNEILYPQFRFMRAVNGKDYLCPVLWPLVEKYYDQIAEIKLEKVSKNNVRNYFRYDALPIQHRERTYVDNGPVIVIEKNGRVYHIQKDIMKTCLWHRNYVLENFVDDPPDNLCLCQVCKWCNKVVDRYGGPKKVICPNCK